MTITRTPLSMIQSSACRKQAGRACVLSESRKDKREQTCLRVVLICRCCTLAGAVLVNGMRETWPQLIIGCQEQPLAMAAVKDETNRGNSAVLTSAFRVLQNLPRVRLLANVAINQQYIESNSKHPSMCMRLLLGVFSPLGARTNQLPSRQNMCHACLRTGMTTRSSSSLRHLVFWAAGLHIFRASLAR